MFEVCVRTILDFLPARSSTTMLRLASATLLTLLFLLGPHACNATRNAVNEREDVASDHCWRWLAARYDNGRPEDPVQGTWLYELWDNVELFVRHTRDGCKEIFTARCASKSVSSVKDCPGRGERPVEQTRLSSVFKRTYTAGNGAEIHLGDRDHPQIVLASGSITISAEHPTVAQAMEAARRLRDPLPEHVDLVASFIDEVNGHGDRGRILMNRVKILPRTFVGTIWNTVRRLRFARSRWLCAFGHILTAWLMESEKMRTTRSTIAHFVKDVRRYNLLTKLNTEQMEGIIDFEQDATEMPSVMLSYMYGDLQESTSGTVKPRALILSCPFGSGHTSAAKAVSGYLAAGGFETIVIDTFTDDFFRSIDDDFGAYRFNELVLKRQWYGVQNMGEKVRQVFQGQITKRCPSPKCDNLRKALLRSAIVKVRPDIIITVYHMEMMPILELAGELGSLPYMHISTDMDIKMSEVFSTKGPVPIYEKWAVGVCFPLAATYKTIAPLRKENTFLSGYPVREDFLKPAIAKSELAAERAKIVPEDTLLVLVMTGGGGQDVPWPMMFANEGASLGKPVRVMVVAGANNAMAKRLEQALPGRPDSSRADVLQGTAPDVTVQVVRDPSMNNPEKPYFVGPKHLALLMDVSDVLITKPGGGTTAEAAYRGIPALFDATAGLLHWEEFTVREFERRNRGIRVTSEREAMAKLKDVIAMGHSTVIAQDPDNPALIIDSARAVREVARDLISRPCPPPCFVFADDTLD